MAASPDAGQLLAMLLKIVNAKRTIEVGVFAGYSLLLTALTIPEDGQETNEGRFDFAFVDADKVNFWNYHERLLKLVRIGGLLVYDNALWTGTVVWPEEEVPDFKRANRHFTLEFNQKISADPWVETCIVPSGDGVAICRRIC